MWHKACMSSQCKTHSQVVNCNKNLAMTAQHDHLDRASAFTRLKILFMQSLKVGVHVCASMVGTACLFNISFFYHHNCSLVFAFSNPHSEADIQLVHAVSYLWCLLSYCILPEHIRHAGGHYFWKRNCASRRSDACGASLSLCKLYSLHSRCL